MESFLFFIFSSLEYFSIIALMFALFRFPLNEMVPHTVFICLLLSFVSFTLRREGYPEYGPTIQILIFVICIWLLYRIHWFYAFLMGVAGYQAYVLLQMFIVIIASHFNLIQFEGYTSYLTPSGMTIFITSLVLTFIIRHLMIMLGWGFISIGSDEHTHIRFKGFNLVIFILAIAGFVLMAATSFMLNRLTLPVFLLLVTFQFILMMASIYFFVKQEMK